ncbi:MAG: hypothetical protein ABIM89_01305, partial [Mycobacteriales bacterium]
GFVWAADSTAGELVRIDPMQNRVISRHRVAGSGDRSAVGLVSDGSSLWTTAGGLVRVDALSGETTGTYAGGHPRTWDRLAIGEGSLWAVCCVGASLQQIDPESGRVAATVPFPVQVPSSGIAVGHGAVWVNAIGGGDGVLRFDPVTKAETLTSVAYVGGNAQGNIAVTDDAVWAEAGDTLVRIDPDTREVTGKIGLPANSTVSNMAGQGDTLWVVAAAANRLWRIDSRTSRMTGVVEVAGPLAVVATTDAVWVAGTDGLHRVDPGLMSGPEPAPDPAIFEVVGIRAAVPAGWHARSLGTTMISTGGYAAIQLASFSFDVDPGAEDPILAMDETGVVLTIEPNFHIVPPADRDVAVALGREDVITGAAVPRGRALAGKAFTALSGAAFTVEAHFGKEDLDAADFARVNAVLAGVRIDIPAPPARSKSVAPGLVEPRTGTVTWAEFTTLGTGTTLDVTRKGSAVRSQESFDSLFVDDYHLAGKAPRLPPKWGAIFVTLPPASCPLPTDVIRLEVVELLGDAGASTYLAVAVIDPALATRKCSGEVPGGHSVFAVAVPPDVAARVTGAAARLADEPLLLPPGTH